MSFDDAKAQRLLEEAAEWQRAQVGKADPRAEFQDAKRKMLAALATAPENVEIPYSHTEAGMRFERFRPVCDPAFLVDRVDMGRVRNILSFKRVLDWDGSWPGPCCSGVTGQGKTFAAWQALRRLYVEEAKPFAWFPVQRLISEMTAYDKKENLEDFFRMYDFLKVLFVDDLDKINWDFESQAQYLFGFMDWVYRTRKPVIVTTNRGRIWWKDKLGEALVRRLFDEGCREVAF